MELLAHISDDNKRCQTLSAHSEKVGALCRKYAGKIGLESMGEFIGLMHDSGKGSYMFQEYLRSGDISMRGRIPHAFCGARYCLENWETGEGIKELTAQFAQTAVCSHHSGLPDVTGVDASDNLRGRMFPKKNVSYEQAVGSFFGCIGKERLDGMFESSQKEVETLYNKICAGCGNLSGDYRRKTVLFQLGMVQRYLLSCLIDADRYDTYLFESGEKPDEKDCSKEFWKGLASRLENHIKSYPHEKTIDIERGRISDQCLAFSRHERGIFRLSVPTGAGKTMASVRYALNCAAQNGKSRIFYIAPYKSILEQNAKDIRDALKIRDDDIILEHHGDVVIDEREYEKNKSEAEGGSCINISREEHYRLLTQRWESPIILTTAVQFLNTLFNGRTSCVRRMHSLAGSVIIVDEYQAMPVKCTYLINAALDFLAYVCGCSVVLCTATQPNAEEMEIPVVFGIPERMTDISFETGKIFRRARAVDKTREGALASDQIAEFIFERMGTCDNMLVILNTKTAAKKLYAAVKSRMDERAAEEKIPVYCLTASLCPAHRMEIIEEINKKLSDDTPGGNRVICISTQLVEAGVNLSFQCVARSLAGLDSVAQAAGRCNRHGEDASRDVFIIKCSDENLSELEDISRAREAAENVLENFKLNPERLGNSLLSPEAVKSYYRYYYDIQKCRGVLAYPVKEKDDPKLFSPTDLFDLLSVNSIASKYASENDVPFPQRIMNQAFETAGRIFEPIEKGGINVIVPHGKGVELIETLYSNPSFSRLPALLRRLQRYSVHLYSHEKANLSARGAIDFLPETGVYVLRGEFYDDSLGVCLKSGEMDLLDF